MVKKVLIISTGDINGAYDAAYKLCSVIKEMGHEVKMLVKHKARIDNFIIQYPDKQLSLSKRVLLKIKSIIKKEHYLRTEPQYGFLSTDELQENVDTQTVLQSIGFVPDYIFVGMSIGFMNSTDIYNIQRKTNAQVVNLTVNMNHFTGGCHFSWGCDGYIRGCDEKCPAITLPADKVIAKKNFDRKEENVAKGRFKILAGSGLTLLQAKQSKLYKNQDSIENVNSIIDIRTFNNHNKRFAKQVFSLDDYKFYILVGAQTTKDPRKGFIYLLEALKHLEQLLSEELRKKVCLMIVSREITDAFDLLSFEKKYIDYITDIRLLSQLYQAADLFVNPSIEDSGPMMVSEALACGTPVVGFNTGIIMNMVVDDYNGYQIEMKNAEALALGIKKILELSPEAYQHFSDNAVKQVEEYSSLEYVKTVLEKVIV